MHILTITVSKETLLVFVAITLRLLPSVGKIGQNLNQLQMSGEALREFNDARAKIQNEKSSSENRNLVINDKVYILDCQRWILITGPSGAGKSTSLRAALGLGEAHATPKLKIQIPDDVKVGYVPQVSYVRNVSLTENIKFFRPNIKTHKIDELIELLELEHVRCTLETDGNASVLSGGERQRISIARALVDDPDVIFLDEAFTSISEKHTISVIEWIKCHLPKSTIIGITHNESEKRKYDEVVNLND